MPEKVDLVMWVRNGEWCLDPVLRRIQEVIPPNQVCCKIFIDDGSTDRTAAIGRQYGWNVISTKGVGVGRAAQTALDHVDTEYYCSFEQDVLLHPKWFQFLFPQILKDPKLAVIQGIRLSSLKVMRVMEKWRARRLHIPISIDNNIYRTEAIRQVGGYPKRFFAGVDTGLYWQLKPAGWKWLVDRSFSSLHLRKSLFNDITRLYRYHTIGQGEAWRINPSAIHKYAFKFLFSPFRGLMIAIEYRHPSVAWVYPLMRFFSYKGFVDGAKIARSKST